jgi:hypothetical protein
MSGPWAKPLALRDLFEIRKRNGFDVRAIATGGCETWSDAIEFALFGADLIGICTAILAHGFGIIDGLTEGVLRYMDRMGYEKWGDMRGILVPEVKSAPTLTLFPGHARCKDQNLSGPCKAACPNQVPAQAYVEKVADRAWLPALKEGLVYAWRERAVRDLLLRTPALGFFIFPYQAFLPAFARDVLGTGPEGYGYLLTAVGVGAIAGAGFAGTRWAARYARPAIIITAALSGVALAAAAVSTHLLVAAVTLAVLGLVSISYLAVANASIQLATRDDLVGRVMGLWTVVNAGTTPVGSLAIGAASERVGLTTALAGAGIACALCGIVAARAMALGRKGEPSTDSLSADSGN